VPDAIHLAFLKRRVPCAHFRVECTCCLVSFFSAIASAFALVGPHTALHCLAGSAVVGSHELALHVAQLLRNGPLAHAQRIASVGIWNEAAASVALLANRVPHALCICIASAHLRRGRVPSDALSTTLQGCVRLRRVPLAQRVTRASSLVVVDAIHFAVVCTLGESSIPRASRIFAAAFGVGVLEQTLLAARLTQVIPFAQRRGGACRLLKQTA